MRCLRLLGAMHPWGFLFCFRGGVTAIAWQQCGVCDRLEHCKKKKKKSGREGSRDLGDWAGTLKVSMGLQPDVLGIDGTLV